MVSQQICPACATPNSTYAPKCRNCSAPLNPRPLPGDPLPWGARAAEPTAPAQAPNDGGSAAPAEYEMAPRADGFASPAGAAHHAWPAHRLAASAADEHPASGLWTDPPREETQSPSSNGHPSPTPAAPSDTVDDAPAVYESPAPAALPGSPDAEVTEPSPDAEGPERAGAFSFHLDGIAGDPTGNGHAPGAAPAAPLPATEPPAPTSTFASIFATPAPSPERTSADEDGGTAGGAASWPSPSPSEPAPGDPASPAPPMRRGGRGWGVRESRTPAPAWAPVSAGPSDGDAGPRSGPGYSAGSPFFASAAMAASAASSGTLAWGASSRARSRSSAVKGLFAVLLLVVLIFAGGFWYFTYGPGAPKAHTVSAPATLGGLHENSSGTVGQLTSAFQARFAGEAHVKSAVFSFYGGDQSGNGYLLGLFAFDGTVRGTDLASFVNGFDSGASTSTFDLSTASTTVRGGVTYHCGAVGLSSLSGTLCVWSDVNVIGSVIGLPGESAGATLGAAEEARSTAEH